jgi:hypothetical protein
LNPGSVAELRCVDSRFAEPIELPGGVKLASLREAIVHLIKAIPTSERTMPEC